MAATFLLSLGFLLSLLQSSGAQTIIGLSPYFDHRDPPATPSPDPNKQSVLIWPSLPSRGRSDVPIRPTVKDKLANTGRQAKRGSNPTPQSPPSFISALSTHNLSSGPLMTQAPSSRARTDTAHLAKRGHVAKVDPTSKGLIPSQPALVFSDLSKNPEKETIIDATDGVLQDLGSGSIPTEDEIPVLLPAVGDEMAQYQPPPQTTVSMLLDLEPPAENQTRRPHLFLLTPANKISTTPSAEVRPTASPVTAPTQTRTVILPGKKKIEILLKSNLYIFYILYLSVLFFFRWPKDNITVHGQRSTRA